MVRCRWAREALWIGIPLLLWAAWNLYGPYRSDLGRFDPEAVAAAETELWRAYYGKERVRFFRLLGNLLGVQYRYPWLRAQASALTYTRAVFRFQEGDEQRALPLLEDYFATLCRIGGLDCDPAEAARRELEWWSRHRRTADARSPELVEAVAAAKAALHGGDPSRFREFARLRCEAMGLRDREGRKGEVAEGTWAAVRGLLEEAYRALREANRAQSVARPR